MRAFLMDVPLAKQCTPGKLFAVPRQALPYVADMVKRLEIHLAIRNQMVEQKQRERVGAVTVEVALLAAILLPACCAFLVLVCDMAQYNIAACQANNAAMSAGLYGSQSVSNAMDNTAMEQLAITNAPSLSSFNATYDSAAQTITVMVDVPTHSTTSGVTSSYTSKAVYPVHP